MNKEQYYSTHHRKRLLAWKKKANLIRYAEWLENKKSSDRYKARILSIRALPFAERILKWRTILTRRRTEKMMRERWGKIMFEEFVKESFIASKINR